MARETEVLIVGAGPTGLVLALWLAHRGIRLRIIDAAPEPGTTSRALAVHARILEFYDQIGLAREIAGRGLKMSGARLWAGGRERGRVFFGDRGEEMGEGLSPFPYVLIFPQDEHERLLIRRLKELGVTVERPLALAGFEQTGAPGAERVTARLRRPDGSEEVAAARFLAGCDGAHSAVRDGLATGFPGGTYSHVFYVADVEARGPAMNGELNLGLDEAEFLAIFPLKGAEGDGMKRARFIGTVKPDAESRHDLGFDDVSHRLIDSLSLRVERVNWFSTYRVHHRVAGHFRQGSVFLAGDAAHIHSPVGGQGMNTGIGDAVNLAWKLAAVLRGRASPAILESYEPERIAFARRLVATTDRAFQLILAEGPLARFARRRLTSWLLPKLFRFAAVRRQMFLAISQIAISYRGSPLAAGWAGRLQPGDRLPWLSQPMGFQTLGPEAPAADNYAALKSLDWQVHVYGIASPAQHRAAAEAGLPLYRFDWSEAAARAGLERDALYLIRPDGYIGLAAAGDPAPALAAYRARFGLDFAEAAPPLAAAL
jgi:2-polyprenyl-6-methoxyphenol hydroxylase-like FAD-dependent oxidoreductase